jgi:hypothetical protein
VLLSEGRMGMVFIKSAAKNDESGFQSAFAAFWNEARSPVPLGAG